MASAHVTDVTDDNFETEVLATGFAADELAPAAAEQVAKGSFSMPRTYGIRLGWEF